VLRRVEDTRPLTPSARIRGPVVLGVRSAIRKLGHAFAKHFCRVRLRRESSRSRPTITGTSCLVCVLA